MDQRMNQNQEILEREGAIAEQNSSSFGRNKLYRMLPSKDKQVYDNRVVMLLWQPAIVCPEIFGKFYPIDMWDYKALVMGHWLTDEVEGVKSFVYCPVETARYYAKLFKKSFDIGECKFCKMGDRAKSRYVFEVFDYQKLIGEKDLDEGEDRPYIQILSGPETVYKQLHSKWKAGYEFWDNKIVRITKDTKNGARYADYTVEVEAREPVELQDPKVKAYLSDPSNLINPVSDAIRLVESANATIQVEEKKESHQRQATSRSGVVVDTPKNTPAAVNTIEQAEKPIVTGLPATPTELPDKPTTPDQTAKSTTTGGRNIRW